MIEQIPIDQIDPNPYQTRAAEDPEHVKTLAFSIAERGLLQIPIGRAVADGGYKGARVQLAFGHSRLAAYKLLHSKSSANSDWSTMPVNIQELDDQQMIELAVSENRDRKDLNPIDEAKAMAVYRDQFGKTSNEIGQLFHLSDSAVRNKIRLLDLPQEAKDGLKAGTMTEGAARALLPFLALPVEVQKEWMKSEDHWVNGNMTQPNLLREAIDGKIGAEDVSRRLSVMTEKSSYDLGRVWWKFDDELKSNTVRSLTCRRCELRRDNKCLDFNCYYEKKQIYIQNYLYLASKASGIKILEADRQGGSEHTEITHKYYWESQKTDQDKAKAIIAGGCENLRVAFDEDSQPAIDSAHCVTDYPRAKIVCRNHSGTCRCLAGYEAVKESKEKPAELTSDLLRQAAADQLKTRRNENEIAAKLMDLAGELLGNAAANFNEQALIHLVSLSGLYSGSYTPLKPWQEVAKGKALSIFRSNMQYITLAGWLKKANQILAKCGLPQLSPEDVGKTAEEMMATPVEEMVVNL